MPLLSIRHLGSIPTMNKNIETNTKSCEVYVNKKAHERLEQICYGYEYKEIILWGIRQ